MPLAAYQASYNGLTFGDGTTYDIVSVEGLEDLDALRTNDIPRARDHGEWAGTDLLTGRDVTLILEVTAATDSDFRAAVEAIMAATVPQSSALPLQYSLPGMAQAARQALVVPRKRPVVLNYEYTRRIAQIACLFHASDFRIYDAAVQTLSTGLPASNGGLTWPTAWPVGWGATGVAGTVSCVNAGNWASRPVITITGPVDNPSVQNLTTGQVVTFGISLVNTDSLVIDMLNKTVILNGTASRRNTMTSDSQWWELAPGTTSVAYRASTVQVGSLMTIQFQSAWT